MIGRDAKRLLHRITREQKQLPSCRDSSGGRTSVEGRDTSPQKIRLRGRRLMGGLGTRCQPGCCPNPLYAGSRWDTAGGKVTIVEGVG